MNEKRPNNKKNPNSKTKTHAQRLPCTYRVTILSSFGPPEKIYSVVVFSGGKVFCVRYSYSNEVRTYTDEHGQTKNERKRKTTQRTQKTWSEHTKFTYHIARTRKTNKTRKRNKDWKCLSEQLPEKIKQKNRGKWTNRNTHRKKNLHV